MWRDDAYLFDMLSAARRVLQYTAHVTREQFEQNSMLQDAVMRQLEIIGEAARCVSQEVKDAHSEVPWKQIVGMRNRLIHHYFKVDVAKVWDVVQNDLAALVEAVEPLIPPDAGA